MATCEFCGSETYSDKKTCSKCRKEIEKRVKDTKERRGLYG